MVWIKLDALPFDKWECLFRGFIYIIVFRDTDAMYILMRKKERASLDSEHIGIYNLLDKAMAAARAHSENN